MSLSVKEILLLGRRQLEESNIENPSNESKELFCFMGNISKTQLILEYQKILADNLCERYFSLLDRRCQGEPLQYITQYQEFMGYPFFVDKRVLIPRQDTETLVEDCIEIIKEGTLRGREVYRKPKKNPEILDLCTGSGAIGISLAKVLPEAKITCSDVSKDALDVAKINGEKNKVSKKINFVNGDLFSPFKKVFGKKTFDVIISNPPYIRKDVIPTLQVEVKNYEPLLALDGGLDGLDFYKKIVDEAKFFLKKEGFLIMEIGHDQGDQLREMLTSSGYEDVEILDDLAGHNRVAFGKKPSLKNKN